MHKRHALTFVTITVFLDTVGFGVIVPVLPEFLVLIGDVSLSDASALSGYLIFSYAVTITFSIAKCVFRWRSVAVVTESRHGFYCLVDWSGAHEV